jgi:hypothetical protein
MADLEIANDFAVLAGEIADVAFDADDRSNRTAVPDAANAACSFAFSLSRGILL